uniref:Uncharacterized protein n=1 Tax=Timema genevievae TaxID=629358 RepID=A0A7R9K6Q7_TIMGE|nr:unnamed protein product [Timema genevievae]
MFERTVSGGSYILGLASEAECETFVH